jgi:hypothetical protein
VKLKAINSPEIDINGTSLKGYITTTRRGLNLAFGNVDRYEGDKVQYHWTLLFEVGNGIPDIVADIYDYKEYQDIDLDTPYRWHIGGSDHLAVACIYSALTNRGAVVQIPDDFMPYTQS